MVLGEASTKINGKIIFHNPQDKRNKQKPEFIFEGLVRIADIEKVFSKGKSTNFSNLVYTTTNVLHDATASYRIRKVPERYNENL